MTQPRQFYELHHCNLYTFTITSWITQLFWNAKDVSQTKSLRILIPALASSDCSATQIIWTSWD